ncbi:unnamed protein product [Aphis gossypii]|uniref:Uncharacterized protein n=1 Tax=Aphis gossypii TaxID=80765 RepID=A0A9P0NH08_APHGO|nr:unnamed protein product [Aphis gossypii]
MPNISASITNDGDTAAIEAPAAVAVQQVSAKPLEHCPGSTELANYVGPEMQYYVGLVNAEVMVSPAATGEDEIRSPSVTSDPPVSVAQPKHDGSGESDAAKFRIFDGRRPRLWCSMPNIAIHYTDKVFYKTAEIECITPMPVSNDSLTGGSTTARTEPTEVTPVKIKHTSSWKRAKKFTRRVFCCGTA